MKPRLHRRQFLVNSIQAGSVLVLGNLLQTGSTQAMEPFKRGGAARLSLSLAAYSFRDYFQDSNHKQEARADSARRLDLFQFIDFCAEHGCQGTELTSYYFPKECDDDFLRRLRRHAFLRGIAVSGTAVGNNFTLPPGEERRREIDSVKRWIERAHVLGAPHIRVFAGSAQRVAKADAWKWAIEALQESCDYAARHGIVLGLENHGGIVADADSLLEIVQAVQSSWFGINLDTGNFNTEDPYGDLARCAPYAVNVQVKTEIQKRGQKKEPADLERLTQILRAANYQGFVALEYEAAENPWDAVPRVLQQLKRLF